MTDHALILRPTVIGGETADGDYSVFREDRLIGRIRKTEDINGTVVWSWSITVPLPSGSWTRGGSNSLDAAKVDFRSTWESFYASLTPDEIRRWHHTQDARKS